MIPIRGFQLICGALIAVLTAQPVEERPIEFSVGVLGELEREDGSWEGVDLLRQPGAPIHRAQVWIRVRKRMRVRVDAVEALGDRALVSQPQQFVTLAPGKLYVFPSPHDFFRVTGEAHLKVTVSLPEPGRGAPIAAVASGKESTVEAALTDGAPFALTERGFRGSRAAALELRLSSPVSN